MQIGYKTLNKQDKAFKFISRAFKPFLAFKSQKTQ